MTIKIEPGKSYRDREGRRWDYVGPSGDEDFPHWFCLTHSDTTSTFTDSGGYFLECIHYYDLIAEWTEPDAPPTEKPEEAAIPMLLWCPECGERHIDEGKFATKLHHTHACQSCGHVWRPAIVATCGVRFLPGFKNADAMMEARKK